MGLASRAEKAFLCQNQGYPLSETFHFRMLL